MTQQLLILRGLPASGKSTYAREWVNADPLNRARVNRDDLRDAIHGGPHDYDFNLEKHITTAADVLGRAMLAAGKSVIVDAMNLRQAYVRGWVEVGREYGAEVNIMDFAVDPEECVARDALRDRSVGAEFIRDTAKRFGIKSVLGGALPPLPPEIYGEWSTSSTRGTYAPDTSLPPAIIVDLDGTVALHDRSPYDYDRLGTDRPNRPVLELINMYLYGRWEIGDPVGVIFVSGRPDSHRELTEQWLDVRLDEWDELRPYDLFMRAADDKRNDAIVKREIFDNHIRDKYNVIGVFDDRNRVVRMWRDLGLQVYQVADGNF